MHLRGLHDDGPRRPPLVLRDSVRDEFGDELDDSDANKDRDGVRNVIDHCCGDAHGDGVRHFVFGRNGVGDGQLNGSSDGDGDGVRDDD